MKKLLILLFSLFLLSSPSVFADDISDFEIEGMSIGDSLLDYMTEDEIISQIERNLNRYYYLKEPNKYALIYLFSSSETYNDGISFFIENNSQNKYITSKKNHEKYKILNIRGMIEYKEDFDNCMEKRDEIVGLISGMFPNTNKGSKTYAPVIDPSGDSIQSDIYFYFKSKDVIEVSCENYEEDFRSMKGWTEGLNVVIHSKEIIEWLHNEK